ncbi:MAG: hypothetical protein WCF85_08140 [Rhodospirillaceae bacterium]
MPKHNNKTKPNPQLKKDNVALLIETCVKNVKDRRKSLKVKDTDNEAWRKQYAASLRSVPQRST